LPLFDATEIYAQQISVCDFYRIVVVDVP